MKRFATVLLAGMIVTSAALSAERKVKIEVTELSCPSCPYIAAQAVEEIDSAKIVDGMYDAAAQLAQFVVTYDDTKTTPEEIAAASEQYGYPGKILEYAFGS